MHYNLSFPTQTIPSHPKEIHRIVQSSPDAEHLVVIIVVSASVAVAAGVSTRVIIIASLGALSLSLLGQVVVLEQVASLLHQFSGSAVTALALSVAGTVRIVVTSSISS